MDVSNVCLEMGCLEGNVLLEGAGLDAATSLARRDEEVALGGEGAVVLHELSITAHAGVTAIKERRR